MKILLINPPWPGKGYGTRSQNRIIKQRADLYLQYPLLMGFSCARLKKAGHQVFYIDSVIDQLNYAETNKKIKEIKPDIIVTETVTPSIEFDLEYIKKMKALTKAKIIVTGPHVTYFSDIILKQCPAIDVVIKADYDTRILEVVDNISNKSNLNKIPGIAFKDKSKVIQTKGNYFIENLDQIPFPDRETIPFYKYGESWYNKKPFINMLTSRGCPFACKFCISANVMEGKKWRTRSVQNVIAEIKEVVTKYNVKEINIDDPTFTIDRKRVLDFCKLLRKNKLKILWTCNARVDTVDFELLKVMKKAGCKMVRYGIESADPEVLKSINKGITMKQMKTAFRLTKKAGILALGGFMFGFPADSKATIERTLKLAKELRPDLIQASIPMIYPGTPLYEEAKKQGTILATCWKEFDMTYGPVVKTKDASSDYLKGILNRVYKEFYFRPGFIFQTLAHIRRFSDITRIFRTLLTLIKTAYFYKK